MNDANKLEKNDVTPDKPSDTDSDSPHLSTKAIPFSICEKDEERKVELSVPCEKPEVQVPVCIKFKYGNCPHGMSGSKIYKGVTCKFTHPKVCRRFINYGPFGSNGCHLGRNCEFFHPQICRHSFRDLCCLDKNCQRWHLKNTIFEMPTYETSTFDTKEALQDQQPGRQQRFRPRHFFDTTSRTWNLSSPDNTGIGIKIGHNNSQSGTVLNLEAHPTILSIKESIDSINVSIKDSISAMCQQITNLQNFLWTNNPAQSVPVAPTQLPMSALPFPAQQPLQAQSQTIPAH